MKKTAYHFDYDVVENMEELDEPDFFLLKLAKENTQNSYAPYSHFKVSAVAKLSNGKIISGTNQENASYPAGICAERVLLSSCSSQYPNVEIETIAISYNNENGTSLHPISPCGICRQTLQEYEHRQSKPIRLILGGMQGHIFIIPSSSLLMPLAFTKKELTH